MPGCLQQTGKVSNPWPNADAVSGLLLQHVGIAQEEFYTVIFGVSRSLGMLSQVLWSRAVGLPIERPGSVTFEELEARVASVRAKL